MKRALIILLSIIMLTLSLVACGKNGDVPNGMKVANDKSNGFYTMYVPENWEVIETASNVTLAQAQVSELKTNKLTAVTVNAMFWQMDQNYETKDEAYNGFFTSYDEQMKETFGEENYHPLGEVANSPYYEGAKEYTYVAKYGDIYYKYVVTVIAYNKIYYAITFNFPQSNLKVDAAGTITPTENYEKADFDYIKSYNSAIDDIVSNFKPLK